MLLSQIFYTLEFSGNNRLRGRLELRLFGLNDLLEFLFSRRYFYFRLLFQLGHLLFHILALFCFELGFLPFHFLLVLEFELGDETLIFHCSLALLLFQHLRKLLDQLFRLLFSLRLDLL